MAGNGDPFLYDKLVAEDVYEDYKADLTTLQFTENNTDAIGTSNMPKNNTIMVNPLVFNRGPVT